MKMETCIEIAARVWCDKEFEHVVMDHDAAMKIANILYFVANSDVSNCPCDCSECFLLGDSVPDWPQRKVCKKLDKLREHCWENEGGFVKD
jgi:hypothetical protein